MEWYFGVHSTFAIQIDTLHSHVGNVVNKVKVYFITGLPTVQLEPTPTLFTHAHTLRKVFKMHTQIALSRNL